LEPFGRLLHIVGILVWMPLKVQKNARERENYLCMHAAHVHWMRQGHYVVPNTSSSGAPEQRQLVEHSCDVQPLLTLQRASWPPSHK